MEARLILALQPTGKVNFQVYAPLHFSTMYRIPPPLLEGTIGQPL